MGRSPARFRISIKDQKRRTSLKVELIDAPGLWNERRYALRVNGRVPDKMPAGSFTQIFERLRHWMVRRAD